MKKINLHYKDKNLVEVTFDQVTIEQMKMILERQGLIQDNFNNISESFSTSEKEQLDEVFKNCRELISNSFLIKDIETYSKFYSLLSSKIQGSLEKVLSIGLKRKF